MFYKALFWFSSICNAANCQAVVKSASLQIDGLSLNPWEIKKTYLMFVSPLQRWPQDYASLFSIFFLRFFSFPNFPFTQLSKDKQLQPKFEQDSDCLLPLHSWHLLLLKRRFRTRICTREWRLSIVYFDFTSRLSGFIW